MNNNNLNKTREEKLNRGFVFPHNNLKESFQTQDFLFKKKRLIKNYKRL